MLSSVKINNECAMDNKYNLQNANAINKAKAPFFSDYLVNFLNGAAWSTIKLFNVLIQRSHVYVVFRTFL